MLCPIQSGDNAQYLLDYCARRLEPESAGLLERHARQCPKCAELIAAQRTVWAALDSWQVSEAADDFDQRLYRRIEQRRTPAIVDWITPVSPVRWRPAYSVAAACVILLAGFLLRGPDIAPTLDDRRPVDIEQLERTLEDLDMLRSLSPSPSPQTGQRQPL